MYSIVDEANQIEKSNQFVRHQLLKESLVLSPESTVVEYKNPQNLANSNFVKGNTLFRDSSCFMLFVAAVGSFLALLHTKPFFFISETHAHKSMKYKMTLSGHQTARID